MVLNPRSTKKTNRSEEKSIVENLLANAFEKGNPDVCMRCQCDVRGIARVTDAHSLHAVCLECLAVESHMEFVDVDDEAWIPFNDALMYDRYGRDITKLVREMVEAETVPLHMKVHRMFEGQNFLQPLPQPSEVGEEKMIELRSILAAIDMAIDLGYKDDFLDLTEKYKKLIREDDLNGF